MRKQIRKNIIKILLEQDLLDTILDKISKKGKEFLSKDEREYLNQQSQGKVDPNLERWLLSQDMEKFDPYTEEKLLYSEFKWDEDIFYNIEKTKRIISKALGSTPFTDSANWADAWVWDLDSKDGYTGKFLYLSIEDEDLVVLKRIEGEGGHYEDEVILNIKNVEQLYKFLISQKK